jgi:hypothetical protein
MKGISLDLQVNLEFDPIEKESLFRERENSNFIIKA